jgi:hypothetical protein
VDAVPNLNEREHEVKALDSHVLAVAVRGGGGFDWAAYIGAVAGVDHASEAQEVYAHGTKLYFPLAKFLFPAWAKKYSWRS